MVMNKFELVMMEYWNNHGYKFFSLNQKIETFSRAFRENGIKRPDFMISFCIMGTHIHIYADTKQRQFNRTYRTFTISEDDVQALHNFKVKFHNTTIFVILSNEDSGFRTFYVISVEDIIKKCEVKTNRNTGEKFCIIKIIDCITLGWNDGFEKIIKL